MDIYILSLHLTASILLLTGSTDCHEYGSFHNSRPPFHYFRSRFACHPDNETIQWDILAIEIHPANQECGAVVSHHQVPELWKSMSDCLNEAKTSSSCIDNPEEGIMFKMDVEKFMQTSEIVFPCNNGTGIPEILAVHIVYGCSDRLGVIHDPMVDGDIMTPPPLMPPFPGSQPAPAPPAAKPTMSVQPEDSHVVTQQHNIVNIPSLSTTQASVSQTEKTTTEDKTPSDVHSTHTITANELATIVGPSVAALCLLLIVAIVILVFVRRNQLKLPGGDMQGESLFSRRFSTASQISDISINPQPFRAV